MKTKAMATLGAAALLASLAMSAPASATSDSVVNVSVAQKFGHGSDLLGEYAVVVNISAGSKITVNTSDSYKDRVNVVQASEVVNVYGVGAGGAVLLGTTSDLADAVESASSSSSFTASADFTSLKFTATSDTSSANSVFVSAVIVAPAALPVPTTVPAPETTVPAPVVTVPAPLDAPVIVINCELTSALVVVSYSGSPKFTDLAVNGVRATSNPFRAANGDSILATSVYEDANGVRTEKAASAIVDCPVASAVPAKPVTPSTTIPAPTVKPSETMTELPHTGTGTGILAASGLLMILGGRRLLKASKGVAV